MASWAISIQNGGKSSIYVPSPSLMPGRQMVSIKPPKKTATVHLGRGDPTISSKEVTENGGVHSFILVDLWLFNSLPWKIAMFNR